jgi:hypothetical protein
VNDWIVLLLLLLLLGWLALICTTRDRFRAFLDRGFHFEFLNSEILNFELLNCEGVRVQRPAEE